MNINIPGILLAITLIWWVIVHLTVSTPFGIFVLVTGIVWALVSIGIHSGTINRP